jgi:hypothetical protein
VSRRAALALIVVLPVAVGLPLREQLRYYDTHRARETVTVVPPGGTGYLNHASWRLRSVRRAGDGVRIRVDETALDDQGTVQVVGIQFLVVDRAGRSWTVKFSGGESDTPGQVAHLTFRGQVPSDVADQVEFVVRSRPLKQVPGPAPELRFRR